MYNRNDAQAVQKGELRRGEDFGMHSSGVSWKKAVQSGRVREETRWIPPLVFAWAGIGTAGAVVAAETLSQRSGGMSWTSRAAETAETPSDSGNVCSPAWTT